MRPPSPPPAAPVRREPPGRRGRLAGLGMLAVLPVLLAACALVGTPKTVAVAGPGAGPTGFLFTGGSPRLSPAPGGWVGSPTPGLSVAPWTPASGSAYPGGGAPCPGHIYEGMMNGLSVTPGTGTASVSWPNAGDTAVVRYRVAAESQRLVGGTQAPLAWTTVAPGTGCVTMTTTLTGLTQNVYYVFWLEAVVTLADGTTRDSMIATSHAVLIP